MKKLLFCLLLLISAAAQAQNIKGKVYLEKDKSPAQFATVGLLQLPDSGMVTGVITLTDGGYLFEKVKPGNYFLKVSFVGYRTNGKSVTIVSGKEEFVVDTIFLAETTATLQEVTVVAEKMKGKEMVDRTVYAVPEVIAKSSYNGYDILKKIPQVNVDYQNKITLNGSSNFIIQVDGRQRDADFLNKLNPSDIESIEIISNPSGKYEGNIDGVINIILKKEARYGMNGYVGFSAKPLNKPTIQTFAGLDYAMGKITFYVTGFVGSQQLNMNPASVNNFTQIDSTTSMSGQGRIKYSFSSINSGFDYYMNDKNNMSFNISYKPVNNTVNLISETFLYKNDVPLNTVSSPTDNVSKSNETTVSLFYKKSFKKPVQEFTAESSYYLFKSNSESDFSNSRYLYNSDILLSSYSRIEENINDRNYFSTKLNYVQPIGLAAKIEAGYQFYIQKLSYDFNIDNSETSNMFKYGELRNSVYSGITYNIKKIGMQAILRVEDSHINADSVTQRNYACFLPSVNLQYKFSASHNLKFTYNRRINRPDIYVMNPYYKVDQNYNVSQGNPDLKPDFRDRLQLTYTWNFGSNYFSPYVYQEYFTNKVGNQYQVIVSTVTHSFTTFTKPYNLISGYETGGGINAMLWYVNINARIYKGHYNQYTGQTFVIPSIDYFSYSINSYAYGSLTKNKKTNVVAFLNFNGVSVNAQSKTYTIPMYGFGFTQQIKDHNFGIFYIWPFRGYIKYSRTETKTEFYTSTTTATLDFRNFIMFNYTYRFNKGKSVKKIGHNVEVESDSKNQTIGR